MSEQRVDKIYGQRWQTQTLNIKVLNSTSYFFSFNFLSTMSTYLSKDFKNLS